MVDRVVVAPVSGSLFLIDCTDCVISAAAKQIRLRNCQRCELRVYVPSSQGLIIEVSTDLTVGEWDVSYDGLDAQFELAGYARHASTNYWDKIYDFSPGEAGGAGAHYAFTYSLVDLPYPPL